MATTTTNFGWDIPQSTDLVKDGATAIAALGQDIDTAMVDLKGGTTGQVLSKATNTDLDFTWVAQDDSNAIQNAIVDAKGDLISATAADTPARLAVGTNGQVLTADSTAATGLVWSSPGSSSAKAVGLYKSGSQSTSNATFTAITFDSEDYDTSSFHSTSSNTSRVTIPTGLGGYYQINSGARWSDNTTGVRVVAIYKNGSLWARYTSTAGIGTGSINLFMPIIMNLAAADYIEVFAYQNSGGSLNVTGNDVEVRATTFTVAYLGA
jgi:hypothetical protein